MISEKMERHQKKRHHQKMMANYLNLKRHVVCAVSNQKEDFNRYKFEVTFKRIEAFYTTIEIDALTQEEAHRKAMNLSDVGMIEYDYYGESEVVEDYIMRVEKMF